MRIRVDDLQGPEVAHLLRAHLEHSRKWSPPESIHALDLDALRSPEIAFWTAWDGASLLGCGALRELDPSHGEIKSMHTAAEHRGRGVAIGLLAHIIDEARSRCYQRLSLETGSMDGFAPARALYARFGFVDCGPFADYIPDPNSVFMTLDLSNKHAVGEQQSLKEQLVGTWTVVSWEQQRRDGTKLQQYGANPTGIAFFDADGRYIITVMRSDRARYASNALWQGTAEENKATADGTITYFGTYAVSEVDRSVAIHIEGSSFPNWNGADQTRIVAIAGDRLTLTVRPPSGERVDIVWKRAK